MSSAIIVKDLTKKFGDFVAVDKINFEVEEGKIFGFLGANGAGKSTTIRMLCGLLQSTGGTATVGGFDINYESEKVKENIGYMSQKFSLYEDLTIDENINFFGLTYGLNAKEISERKKWILNITQLIGEENKTVKDLSVGIKQRLALGCAVLHRPKIIFLDEPTSGVDPLMRRRFWDLINELSDEGTTIIVTTHFLEEAEYCNNILMIDAGKVIANGSPKELKSKYLTMPIFEVKTNNVIEALSLIENEKWAIEVSIFGTSLHVSVEDEIEGEKLIVKILNENKVKINGISKIVPSLEDVFIYLLEQKNREKND
ncbi:MAG: ABC transporter ATP-binding protein [Bacteroidota bacterium]